VGGDGHVRFIYSNPNDYSGTINIFDFAMDKVVQINNSHLVNNNESEIIWNGRNEYGDQVANGVYFCRLSLNGEYYWTKLAVVN
jgi:glutathionyl-hydroquinone reductase